MPCIVIFAAGVCW